ncbi:Unconventional myosin IC [Gryllus bimaculatus]|nr:Unconventional myosin IC [Gryllus bimaculatus]
MHRTKTIEGVPVGGHILNYLLEKSRVVHQAAGERNFHVFYQLLAGADDALLARLQLRRSLDTYFYCTHGARAGAGLPEQEDATQWAQVRRAMEVVELGAEEQDALLAIVAAVLHLGNVGFTEEEGAAKVLKPEAAEAAARLLGCEVPLLGAALQHRTIEVRGETVTSPLGRDTAIYARDALAKAVYDRLFSWLVARVNASLQGPAAARQNQMGILDIYGFEIFTRNSFEQFCINFCNEKLQQLFIELTLKSEQEEYLREGIEWEPVEYFNNKVICDLIEEKHKGIISLMDEECLRPGDPTDKSFLSKMNANLSNHPHYISHQKADTKTQKIMGRDEFQLKHYAGDVTYNVQGFLDKNNDLLFRDLRHAMSETTNPIIKAVFPASDVVTKRRPDTAATQFKNSLNKLMDILMGKEPSYIRCIKPNDSKSSGIFDEKVVSHQVKYLGLMENLRVRRAGFAFRRPYELFLRRYKCLCPATWPHFNGDAKEGVQTLVNHLNYQRDDFRMGKTKIFIRFPKTLFETEDAFQVKKHQIAAIIQSRWKGRQQRLKFLKMRDAVTTINKYVRRFLAKRDAERRRKAAQVIRRFIEGFITRNGPETPINKEFIEIAKAQYLIRLSKDLPKSVLDNSWPPCPVSCKEASEHLRKFHKLWLAKKYRDNLKPQDKKQFEMKILAESLFKGKKKSYAKSVPRRFATDRLKEENKSQRQSFELNQLQSNEKILGPVFQYSASVTKFDRHGYKPRERVLFLTNRTLYLLEGKTSKLKHNLPLDTIQEVVVTTESDNLVLIRIPPDLKKDKGDLILEVDNLIEAITTLIDITKKPQTVKVMDASSISHNYIGGKQGQIEITTGDQPLITKSKGGHLLVVSCFKIEGAASYGKEKFLCSTDVIHGIQGAT